MKESPLRPIRIGFLLIDGFALMSYSSAIEPLRAANQLAAKKIYDVQHFGVPGCVTRSSCGAQIVSTVDFDQAYLFDLVLVVTGGDPASFDDVSVFKWLRRLAHRGVRLGGVSGGPVILAAAGVMRGYRMTVHWEHATVLSELSPGLVIERSLYVIDRDRITCAGGIAALDMMHAFITEHCGLEFARRVSDWFMHTEIRASSEPQRAGLVERYATTCGPVIDAIEAMENHIADTLDLQQLARLSGVSPRQLNRLFQQKMGRSTISFYRHIRLQKARNLLTSSPLSITEIALATGYTSSAHFSSSFNQAFDMTPSSMRG